jgi:hypothetical protein
MLLECFKKLELRVISLNLDNNKIEYSPDFGDALKQLFTRSRGVRMVELCLSHNEISD